MSLWGPVRTCISLDTTVSLVGMEPLIRFLFILKPSMPCSEDARLFSKLLCSKWAEHNDAFTYRLTEINALSLHEFHPFRPKNEIQRKHVHWNARCVKCISTAHYLVLQPHSVYCFPHSLIEFRHVLIWVKSTDVTQVNHVTFWPRTPCNNFQVKIGFFFGVQKKKQTCTKF